MMNAVQLFSPEIFAFKSLTYWPLRLLLLLLLLLALRLVRALPILLRQYIQKSYYFSPWCVATTSIITAMRHPIALVCTSMLCAFSIFDLDSHLKIGWG